MRKLVVGELTSWRVVIPRVDPASSSCSLNTIAYKLSNAAIKININNTKLKLYLDQN